MNLEESDAFVEEMERTNRKKKSVLTIIIICAIIVAILIVLIMYLTAEDAKKFKVYINGNRFENYSSILLPFEKVTDDIDIEKSDNKNENYFVNIEQMAKLLGYSYQKGEYKSFTEDPNSCCIITPYEIVSMKADSNSFTKYMINNDTFDKEDEEDKEDNKTETNIVVKSKDGAQETFNINNPIKYINNSLYVPITEIPDIFNVKLDISESNRVKMYSLDYLINNYASKVATAYKYSTVSNNYENFTAIVDDMLVVGNGTNFGVVSISTGKEIISLKYEDIVYMQNTKEFQVSAEDSVGVISSEGKTIIKPTEYDTITVLDEFKKLYLVEKSDKYGVINNEGENIIFCDYDSIGISNTEFYSDKDIRNYNLLFDTCIPVELDNKYGLMDLDGNEILRITYDSLGTANIPEDDEEYEDEKQEASLNETKNNNTKKSDQGILTIPESEGIKGIIVKSNGMYGIFDANVQHLITPCVFSKIYSKTKGGVTTYYLEYEGEEIKLSDYLEENDLKSIKQENENSEEDDEQEDDQFEEIEEQDEE